MSSPTETITENIYAKLGEEQALDTDDLAMNRSLPYVTSLNNHRNIVNH